MTGFRVTDEQVREIEAIRPIWLKLVFHQQYHVWVAPPNGGKTTIANRAAADMTAAGFTVWYINLDAGAAQLKEYQALANEGGFNLIAPLASGSSEDQIIDLIDAMLEDDDLTHDVLILDTLKKFTDVVSKASSKGFYKKLRALTRRGCTVIALAHTNKHNDANGELVFEGTGDLRADTDNLMFMYPLKNALTGTLTVSTKFSKERAKVENVTFTITSDRLVSVAGNYLDTQVEAQRAKQEAEDRPVIDWIKDRLAIAPANQSVLIEELKKSMRIGWRSASRILKAYVGKHWLRERAVCTNNEWRFYPAPGGER